MAEPLRTLETPDGRRLAYAVWGDPAGFPIMSLHGTPGCRLERWPHDELYSGHGVCWVSHDRAGYGQSARRANRRVVDEVDDVLAIADELGWERFGVSGGSGGGPHVLACAALLSDRVIRAVCVVGVVPFGPEGFERDDWLAGMDPENVKEFGWALEGEEVLTRELEALQARLEERVAEDPANVLEGFELSNADREALQQAEFQQIVRESTYERCVHGVSGWVDDELAFTKPWGFGVEQVAVPTLIRYGATDVLVPPAHGEWLSAHVPGCIVKIDGGAGHLASDPVTEIGEHIRWLRDGEPPEGSSPSR